LGRGSAEIWGIRLPMHVSCGRCCRRSCCETLTSPQLGLRNPSSLSQPWRARICWTRG
jgi:hypothetical protein